MIIANEVTSDIRALYPLTQETGSQQDKARRKETEQEKSQEDGRKQAYGARQCW